jgi:glycosyltransferase involved in cell wall biosynthesis
MQEDNKKIKLIILSQIFYPELISTGQTLTELAEALVNMDVEVEVVSGPTTIIDQKSAIPKKLTYKGISINRVWGTRFPKLNVVGRIINQASYAISVFLRLLFDRSKRPILVLTNPPFLAFICALLRFLGIGKPYIYLIFDVYPDTAINLGLMRAKGLIANIWDLFNSFAFKYSSAIIVIGRCMGKVIAAKMEKYSLDQISKIKLIHVWCDDALIDSSLGKVNPYIEAWNLQDKFVLSYSGNMGWFHDMETIMCAAKELNSHCNIDFVFVGEGHKKAWMQKYAKQEQLNNCQFHSYVERENLGLSLACANVGLISLLEKQLGLSVPSKTYGYWAAGIPVVAVVPSESEIAYEIRENNAGLVVKPGEVRGLTEAIVTLYNNEKLRKEMGWNGKRSISNKYSLKLAAKAYYDIISELNY